MKHHKVLDCANQETVQSFADALVGPPESGEKLSLLHLIHLPIESPRST